MVNPLAFSGSNYLFTILRSPGAAQASWSRKRTERLDFIKEELRRRSHAVETYRDVEAAMQEYGRGHRAQPRPPGARAQLSDFYHPSGGQRDGEIAFVILGMAPTCLVAYRLAK